MHARRARRLALRAAQLACGLTVGACASTESGADAAVVGLDAPLQDAFEHDSALLFYAGDAFLDARFPGDASCRLLIPRDPICCRLGGGEWYVYDGGFAECFVGVPGPFVPPSLEEAPPPRGRAATRA